MTKDKMIDEMFEAGLVTEGYVFESLFVRGELKKLTKRQLEGLYKAYMNNPDLDIRIKQHDGIYTIRNGEKYYYGGLK